MSIDLYKNDLPDGIDLGNSIAIDTETMGLNPHRDRLCLIQISSGDGNAHLVQFDGKNWDAPNLKSLLSDTNILKIFHFARFDLAVLYHYLNVMCNTVYCTKIMSKLVRTYTDRHGLKNLTKELLNIDISKEQQSSNWSAVNLSKAQQKYAAADVLYLHQLKEELDKMLVCNNDERPEIAKACFEFLPQRAKLDLLGWSESDIFSH